MAYVSIFCESCEKEYTIDGSFLSCPKGHLDFFQLEVMPTIERLKAGSSINLTSSELKAVADRKPLEFDGHDLETLSGIISEQQTKLLEDAARIQGEEGESSPSFQKLMIRLEHLFKVGQRISGEESRRRALSEVNRKMTGFYSLQNNEVSAA